MTYPFGVRQYKNKVAQELNLKKILLLAPQPEVISTKALILTSLQYATQEEDLLDRIKTLLDIDRLGLPVQPPGYTKEEVEKMLREGNRFMAEVIASGKVIYN